MISWRESDTYVHKQPIGHKQQSSEIPLVGKTRDEWCDWLIHMHTCTTCMYGYEGRSESFVIGEINKKNRQEINLFSYFVLLKQSFKSITIYFYLKNVL